MTLAESILDRALEGVAAPQTISQRLCWCARAELALAGGDANRALELVDSLIASSANSTSRAVPRLAKLRGDVLVAQRQFDQAEIAFQSAVESAREQGERPWLWRIRVSLGKMYQAQKRSREAVLAFSAARTIIDELATNIPDPGLRAHFLERAAAMLPRARPPSPRQIAKKKFGGLTEREHEVVALIAQGKTNKEIADTLVLSERTIGAHISNILSKLQFHSRTQVAAWAIEKGLAKLK